MLFRKLLCWIFGHKPTMYFDPDRGDAVLACSRCVQRLKDPDLIYPEDLPNVAIPFAPPPAVESVSGDVVCTGCGAAWHSHHRVAVPVLCSGCRK